jgi:hypothetical protein
MAAAMAAASAAQAEDAAPASPSQDTSSIILAPKATTAAQAPRAAAPHASSSAVSGAIATALPKFTQLAPAKPLGQQPDLRDIDKPRNKIPRLPANMMQKYVVHGARVPPFRDRDLYTKEGLIDLGFKNHPGLLIGNIFGLNKGFAYEAFLRDEKVAWDLDQHDEALAMAVGGDLEEAKMILNYTGDSEFRELDISGPVGRGGGANDRGSDSFQGSQDR